MARDDKDNGRDDSQGGVTLLSTWDVHKPASLLAQIEGHWRELLTRTRGLPRRADIDASRIGVALPHAFILERVAGVALLRVAGQSVRTLLGTDPRGVPLSLLFSPEARPGLQSWLERCFEAPALVEIGISAPQGALRAPLRGRLILLPLGDTEGKVTRAMGGLLLDAASRSGPLRFDIAKDASRFEPVAARGQYQVPQSPSPLGLDEAERPYLRLVVSNG